MTIMQAQGPQVPRFPDPLIPQTAGEAQMLDEMFQLNRLQRRMAKSAATWSNPVRHGDGRSTRRKTNSSS